MAALLWTVANEIHLGSDLRDVVHLDLQHQELLAVSPVGGEARDLHRVSPPLLSQVEQGVVDEELLLAPQNSRDVAA